MGSSGIKWTGAQQRGMKKDKAAKPALIKRQNQRRAIEAAEELKKLLEQIS